MRSREKIIRICQCILEEMARLDEVLVAKAKLGAEKKRALNSNLQTLRKGGRKG